MPALTSNKVSALLGALTLGVLLCLGSPDAGAQSRTQAKKPTKGQSAPRIYCWETPTGRECGDTMPVEAAGVGRDEYSPKTGTRINQVQRAKTQEEIDQENWDKEVELRKKMENEKVEREVSTVRMRYDSVDAIRQDFADRRKGLEVGLGLAEDSARTTHNAFVAALDTVAGLEMDGKTVTDGAFERVQERFKEWQERRSGVETSKARIAELDKQMEVSIQMWLGVPDDIQQADPLAMPVSAPTN